MMTDKAIITLSTIRQLRKCKPINYKLSLFVKRRLSGKNGKIADKIP